MAPDSAALPAISWLGPAARLAGLGQLLLLLAGLRHHLVWGGAHRLWFDAAETAALLGFAWCGARAWTRAAALAAAAPVPWPALRRASLALLGAAVLVPPFLSLDVVDYLLRGRVLAVHGGNPYVQVAADFPADPLLPFGDAAWKEFPLPYGPLVAEVQGLVAWLAQLPGLPPRAELWLGVALFKLLFAGCLWAAAGLARRFAGDRGFVLLAWNPLLLNECVAQAHNEALLLPLLLAAALAAVARPGLAAFAAGAGALAKVVPVLLGPLLLAAAWRTRRLPALCGGAAAAAGLLALLWLRFFTADGALGFLARQSAVTGASIVWALGELGVDPALALGVGRALVVLVLLAGTAAVARAPEPARLLAAAAAALAALAALGVGMFGPWYHVWWAPLALLGGGRLGRAAWWACALAPLGYVVWTATRTFDTAHQAVMLACGVVLPWLLALGPARGPARGR